MGLVNNARLYCLLLNWSKAAGLKKKQKQKQKTKKKEKEKKKKKKEKTRSKVKRGCKRVSKLYQSSISKMISGQKESSTL